MAADALGPGDWVLGVAEPYVVLTEGARSLPEERRDALIDALRENLEQLPAISRAIDTRTLPNSCPPPADESLDALVCRAYFPGAGDLYIVTSPGSFFDPDYAPGKGTSHGTPYLYDRSVPIIARAPGRIAEGMVVDEPRSIAAFVHTAASLLGVEPPSAAAPGQDLARSP